MPFFTSQNIDNAELASTYRTPQQGVSAKSNSNVALSDYRLMTTTRNGAVGNAVNHPQSTTIAYSDLEDTCGLTGVTTSSTTGSTKGQTTTTYNGVFTGAGKLPISGLSNSTAQGFFGLGATNGASTPAGAGGVNVRNGNFQVASFPSVTNGVTNIIGMGSKSAALGGGTLYFVVTNSGYQQTAPAENCWTTIRVRNLNPNGYFQYTLSGTTYTVYNSTATFNRSDWGSFTSGSTRIYSASYSGGLNTSGTYASNGGWVGNLPCIVEII